MKPVDEELELTRLLAEEPSPLASSLAALRDQGPDPTELASLASRLALQGLDVSVSNPPATHAHPWKKWGWGGLGGVSALVVWLALRGPSPVPQVASTPATAPERSVASAAAAPAPGAAAPPSAASTTAPRRPAGEGPSARVAPPAPTSASNAATRGAAAPSAPPQAPLSASDAGATGNQRKPMPTSGSVSNASPAVAASPRAASAVEVDSAAENGARASGGSAAPPTEIELLRDARLALRQSPARALELTDEHGRLYAHGKLAQEREVIAVSALVALGRRTAALSRAAAFERQYPTSPYRKQMSELLR